MFDDNIHDSVIKSYNVDFEKNEINFKVMNFENKPAEIIFKGVLTHIFKNEMPNSIIFDIEEYEAKEMIIENKELLKQEKDYLWPIGYKDTNDLLKKLASANYKYYVIETSFGLYGWVLAQAIEFIEY